MSISLIRTPIYGVTCDRVDCGRTFVAPREVDSALEYQTRREAIRAGWELRPYYGKGSRTAPDLCPDHKSKPTTS